MGNMLFLKTGAANVQRKLSNHYLPIKLTDHMQCAAGIPAPVCVGS